MDPVSLALAITPICLAAINGLILLQSKLKIFRHSPIEIRRIRRKLEIQGDCFQDEIRRLLLKLIEYDTVTSMIDDKTHPEWHSPNLESKIRFYLAEKYKLYLRAVEEWRETIDNLLNQLPACDISKKTASFTTIRDAIAITVSKSEYIELLESLKESCAELKRIREMADMLHGHLKATSCFPLPTIYADIRNMSSSLHDLLHTRILCNSDSHSDHSVRLILSSESEGSPHMNLFFEQVTQNGSVIERLMRPIYASCNDSTPCDLKKPTWSPTLPFRHFTSSINQRQDRHGKGEEHGGDLTDTRVRCEKFISKGISSSVGYLRIPGNQKLVLYHGAHGLKADCNNLDPKTTISLLQILELPVFDVFTDHERVKLGIILAKSMLKLHSTPWWPEVETLKQVYMFKEGSTDMSSCLDTLHLSMKLKPISSMTKTTVSFQTPQEEGNSIPDSFAESIEYAMHDHGIRNLTLYSLGVALLQIGLWERVPWEDHIQIRRRVERLSQLGKGYYLATKKLICCDFGLAREQLHDPQLQSAVFNHVVGELESVLSIAR